VPKNEDGEFELILGNRQLLSVFFIVVILLGVFFTMGYIVGRNSAPAATEIAATHRETKPPSVDSGARQPEPAPPAPSSSPVESPSPRSPSSEAARPAAPPKTTKPQPLPPEPKPEPAPPAAPPGSSGEEPAPGQTYLQLAATSKREADIMVDVLHQKKFQAIAAEIPEKRGTYRVLVGPMASGDVNQMRADLQAAGFPGNAAIKRTF
jgi:cell division septation protein DedD